ncbi:unnamed protein product [Cuscuta europaea]|uniref:Uncharacterized protein n=1 Tax=Cuscuta europaea TaxID=41803 RepID=A0A9P0Z609_CUSEU|nr:unnamed protein product [Cuscuta europaea]
MYTDTRFTIIRLTQSLDFHLRFFGSIKYCCEHYRCSQIFKWVIGTLHWWQRSKNPNFDTKQKEHIQSNTVIFLIPEKSMNKTKKRNTEGNPEMLQIKPLS